MVDTKVRTTFCKFYSFKLSLIIYEDPLGYAKPVYDTLQKLDHYFLRDVYYWHSFYPLGKRVYGDK
jgi:hypothetical protein